MKDTEQFVMCLLAICLVAFFMPFYYNWAPKKLGIKQNDTHPAKIVRAVDYTLLTAMLIAIFLTHSVAGMLIALVIFVFALASATAGQEIYRRSDPHTDTPPK